MSRLSLRRYPDIICRRRQGPGTFDRAGNFVPGEVTEVNLMASVQPVNLENLLRTEGTRLSERLKVYVPVGLERVEGTPIRRTRAFGKAFGAAFDKGRTSGGEFTVIDENPLAAAFDEAPADEVVYLGLVFIVEESHIWPGSHVKATLLRET